MTRPADHPELGPLALLRSPINLSAAPHPERFFSAAPDPGAHTDAILRDLGYDDARIAQFRDANIAA
jgi:crotonobetainyl-CoA:carnitine CoA-transferase CaiB-like acyl-CoA transferase